VRLLRGALAYNKNCTKLISKQTIPTESNIFENHAFIAGSSQIHRSSVHRCFRNAIKHQVFDSSPIALIAPFIAVFFETVRPNFENTNVWIWCGDFGLARSLCWLFVYVKANFKAMNPPRRNLALELHESPMV
jgi:hypothetical protein